MVMDMTRAIVYYIFQDSVFPYSSEVQWPSSTTIRKAPVALSAAKNNNALIFHKSFSPLERRHCSVRPTVQHPEGKPIFLPMVMDMTRAIACYLFQDNVFPNSLDCFFWNPSTSVIGADVVDC